MPLDFRNRHVYHIAVYVCVCVFVVVRLSGCHHPNCCPPSHHVIAPSPDHAHLINHIPVLQTVLDESAIERVLVSTVGGLEVAVTTVVCPLICGQIEDYCVELCKKEGAMCIIILVEQHLVNVFTLWNSLYIRAPLS